MDKRIFVVFILGLFVIGFVSATSVGVSESEFTEGKVVYTSPLVSFNNGTAYVNSSNFWDNLDTPADILHNLLSNLAWSVAGHTMDTDLDMNDNDITTTGNFTADYGFFNYLGSVISRITKIFASALDVDGDVNITGFLNVSKNITTTDTHCFNADCSAKIYHNGTGLIIES